MNGQVLAIDGPAASGKSTTARRVADALGFNHLNSGRLYRAITWVARREIRDVETARFADLVQGLKIELIPRGRALVVRVDGQEPGPALDSPAVSERVSRISRQPSVRARVLELLREAGRRYDIVCDGRDIGTVVFPDATLKIYLTASADERARRRLLDHGLTPSPDRLWQEEQRLRERDHMDSTRELSPLRKADDAIEIDTTDRAPEEIVEAIVSLWREGDPSD